MPSCPICSVPLQTTRHREGVYHTCPRCDGRAVTIPHLRKVAGDRLAARMLRLLKQARRRGPHNCPFCAKPMKAIAMSEPSIESEGCLVCNAVWLDAPTFGSLKGGVVETTNSLASQATEIYAEIKLKELNDRLKKEAEAKRKRKQRP